MFTDAHCHPVDLAKKFPGAEEERRRLGVLCAASSCTAVEFEYNAKSARKAPMVLCFAVHPQLPAYTTADPDLRGKTGDFADSLVFLETLAREGRLGAVGETGFDLYDGHFRETEKIQEELFEAHLETALAYDLPLVLHIRKAMHKVFAAAKRLKKCRALIFHSWPGTAAEGGSLLRRGINAYFSFGTTIMLNHREAIRCCASFPAERLLLETDAPYQPLRGRAFSTYEDLKAVLETAAALRTGTDGESPDPSGLECTVAGNFRAAFNVGGPGVVSC
jgi:TatD DNase family protein